MPIVCPELPDEARSALVFMLARRPYLSERDRITAWNAFGLVEYLAFDVGSPPPERPERTARDY